MKTYIVIISFLLCGAVGLAQDKKDVPQKVLETFQSEFPNATDVRWEREKENKEAEFKIEGQGAEAILTPEGELLKYKVEIEKNELPQAVRDAIDRDYQGEKYNDTRKLVVKGKTYYQVEIENTFMDEKRVYNPDGSKAENVEYWN
jgi:hypothetical protein